MTITPKKTLLTPTPTTVRQLLVAYTVKPRYSATRYSDNFTLVPVFTDHQIWRFTLNLCLKKPTRVLISLQRQLLPVTKFVVVAGFHCRVVLCTEIAYHDLNFTNNHACNNYNRGSNSPGGKNSCYLGSILNKKWGGAEDDIKARIGKAHTVFKALNNSWRSMEISIRTKLGLFKPNVISV